MQRFKATVYNFILMPGVVQQPTPSNNSRVYLKILSKTPNEVQYQFGRPANNPSDGLITGFGKEEWDSNIPVDGVSLYSILGGNVVIIEGNPV